MLNLSKITLTGTPFTASSSRVSVPQQDTGNVAQQQQPVKKQPPKQGGGRAKQGRGGGPKLGGGQYGYGPDIGSYKDQRDLWEQKAMTNSDSKAKALDTITLGLAAVRPEEVVQKRGKGAGTVNKIGIDILGVRLISFHFDYEL